MLEFQKVTINENKNGIKRKIIDNISFSIEEGSIFGLFGTSQSSKTALIRAASGGSRPDRGMILLDGMSIYSSKDAYQKLGYLPARNGFYEQLTVEEYYELFLALYKVNGRYRKRRIDEVLNLLELESYRDSFLGDVPGEVKAFLGLGKSILHEPSWLLLDNPFEELNMVHRKKMLDYLSMLWEQGITLFISTQIFPEVTALFTEVAVIEEGQMIARGTVEDVYAQVLRERPIRMRVLDGMEQALKVLRENDLVERVTVVNQDVSLLFSGGDEEEAQLLTQLVKAGALVHNFKRDSLNLDQYMWR